MSDVLADIQVMEARERRPFELVLRGLLALAALGCLAMVGWIIAHRLGFPFELEWMEGNQLHLIERLVRGEAMYAEPSLEFTGSVYAPLYYELGALLHGSFENPFVGGRIVSVAAFVGTLVLLADLGGRGGRSWLAALVAPALYAACWQIGDGYYDNTRVDSLFVFWLTAGAWLVRFGRGWSAVLMLGFVAALAIATKQSGVAAPVAWSVAWIWRFHGKHWIAWLGPVVLLALAGIAPLVGLWLDASTDGWARYFLVDQLAHHELDPRMWRGFWTRDLIRPLAPALALTIAWGAVVFWRRDRNAVALGLALAMGVAVSWVSRLHVGGAVNVNYPAYVALALGSALALGRALAAARRGLRISVLVLCIAQLGWLAFDPRPWVPTDADIARGEAFVAELAALDGQVFAPFHGALTRRAGKAPTGCHPVGINDVLRGDPEVAAAYRERILATLDARTFDVIVMPDAAKLHDPWLLERILERYRPERTIAEVAPWLHANVRPPELLFVPK